MLEVIPWDGQKISKPGLYSGIDMDSYHGPLCVGPSISSTGLRDIFHHSPRAYFRNSYLNPQRKPRKTSEAFTFGRAAHHLLLGEADFRKHFIVRPDTYPEELSPATPPLALWDSGDHKPWNSNSKASKAWLFWNWWAHKTVLTARDIEMIRAMAAALAEEPLVQQGVLNGLIECSFVWQDPETGVWIKWRPDAIPTDDLSFADLKTTTDVSDEALERTITEYSYNQQGALGATACDTVLGKPMADFSLVFVEKEDTLPCVRVKTLRPIDIDLGVKQNAIALKTFARCVETGEWLGPGGRQHDAEFSGISEWAYRKIAARIDDMERQLETT